MNKSLIENDKCVFGVYIHTYKKDEGLYLKYEMLKKFLSKIIFYYINEDI